MLFFLAAAPPLRAARAGFVDEAIWVDLSIRALRAVKTAPRASLPQPRHRQKASGVGGLAWDFHPILSRRHATGMLPFAPPVQSFFAGLSNRKFKAVNPHHPLAAAMHVVEKLVRIGTLI